MSLFKVLLSAVDPIKLAKSVKEKYLTNLIEDKDTGIITFQSDFDIKKLKTCLGLPSVDVISEVIKTEEKAVNMGDNQNKLKIDIPILRPGNYEKLKVYINDIKTYKELMKWSDTEIIFASLSKSEQTHLRMSMSDEEQNDLTKYIEFILKNFGISENRIWSELRAIKQKSEESPLAFWHRLCNLYYHARGTSTPASIDKSQQMEIRNLFLNGLKNTELKRLVLVKSIDFENLAQEVNNINMSLNEINDTQETFKVMNINNRGRSPHRSDWRNHSDYRSKSRDRSFDEKSFLHDKVICYKCGRKGHIRAQCRASQKTVRRYKQFLSTHGSRSRSRSRDRAVTFDDEQ